MSSLTIKNLSIALEALSRIPESKELSERVRDLLSDEIREEETQTHTRTMNRINKSKTPDEEIPF